ncbi:MAG: leucine--tRNA ligase [Candidatus Pacearchaeota archaeon]
MAEKEIDFKAIEKKWQREWEKSKIFQVKENKTKKKYYVLEMFPYPSGEGLHMGHAFNYIIGDIFARFKRMNGLNVLYPMGYDSFGLPAENAAIKAGIHPRIYTDKAIKNFIEQQKALGLSYDWDRIVITKDPGYYKWNQFFFLKLYEKGLIYRKKAAVNWCPKCQTVLANEQVHSGKCWRHEDTEVEIKHLEQWFVKTTEYAEELLQGIKKLNWPERIKIMQENWIGKSHGIDILFTINGEPWPIFTTRPDTIYGVTFMVISAQHPKLRDLVTAKQKPEVEKFLKKLKSVSEKELEEMEKEGAFTGSYAINPVNNEKVPVYAGNFVLAEYGSGMVMAVPAHDQRDFEFAKKYNLPIRIVIQSKGKKLNERTMKEAFVEEGILVNSGKFNGINSKEAIEKISDFIEKQKLGKRTVNYKLRDWLISRQRYWGTPIPIIYCDKCGIVPVPENELPILLPENVEFGKGNPLATNKAFVETKCPKCKGKARRETDTIDTFFDSSWYFLRYCDNKNIKVPFSREKVHYWNPVDIYIGGAEHATMHLIYARFFTKVLCDMGFVKINEPFPRLFNQGMLHGSDGYVMSKSRGNVVNPMDIIKKYSADTLRLYLVSQASPDKDTNWNDEAIEGSFRFILKAVNYFNKVKKGKSTAKTESKLNKTIKEFTDDIENLSYNLAIIKLRELFEYLGEEESKGTLESFLKMFSLFCPHISEELWHKLGNKSFISTEYWPKADEKKIRPEFEQQEKLMEQLKQDILHVIKIINKRPNMIYIYVIPKELNLYDSKELEQAFSCKVQIMANNKSSYDPQKKAQKAKPNKPAIYIE